MRTPNTYEVKRTELRFLLDTLETIEAEIEQLTYDEVWYVSDVVDQMEASKQILHDLLGIRELSYDEEESTE